MPKQKVTLYGKTILVTGSPGFIGANLVLRLLRELESGHVVSLDNMNGFYDVSLKEWRLEEIEKATQSSFVRHTFIRGSIANKALIDQIFAEYKPSIVINLAAQAGVRHSIDHPDVYIESNILGFSTFWNLVVTAMTLERPVWSIWSMLPPAPSTVETPRCPSVWRTRLTTRSPFMLPLRNQTS